MPYSKHLPKVMTEVELDLLEKSVNKTKPLKVTMMDEFCRQRDLASFKLMFYTGLRPAECYQLRWSDIDYEKRKIYVRPYINVKRKNDLPAVLTIPAMHVLEAYREESDKIGIKTKYLFPSVWSWSPVAVETMRDRLHDYLTAAGLLSMERHDARGKPIYTYNLYSFRHSFLTYVYKKTHDQIAVSRLARHTQVQSASLYVHLCHDDKVEIADSIFN